MSKPETFTNNKGMKVYYAIAAVVILVMIVGGYSYNELQTKDRFKNRYKPQNREEYREIIMGGNKLKIARRFLYGSSNSESGETDMINFAFSYPRTEGGFGNGVDFVHGSIMTGKCSEMKPEFRVRVSEEPEDYLLDQYRRDVGLDVLEESDYKFEYKGFYKPLERKLYVMFVRSLEQDELCTFAYIEKYGEIRAVKKCMSNQVREGFLFTKKQEVFEFNKEKGVLRKWMKYKYVLTNDDVNSPSDFVSCRIEGQYRNTLCDSIFLHKNLLVKFNFNIKELANFNQIKTTVVQLIGE